MINHGRTYVENSPIFLWITGSLPPTPRTPRLAFVDAADRVDARGSNALNRSAQRSAETPIELGPPMCHGRWG